MGVRVPSSAPSKFFSLFLLFSFSLFVFSNGCGKVSQETGVPKAVVDSANINFQVSLTQYLTQPANLLPNEIQVKDSVARTVIVYNQVQGLKENKTQSLSWGKTVLTPKEEISNTQNVKQPKVFVCDNFDANEIRAQQPEYTKLVSTYTPGKQSLLIRGVKIEKNYPYYMIASYLDKDQFQLKVVEGKMLTGNAEIALGELSDYDTFIALLFGIEYQQNNNKQFKLSALMNFFTPEFFNLLGYHPGENRVKKFDPRRPVFLTENTLEKELLNVYVTSLSDKAEAIKTVNRLDEKVVSSKIKEFLISRIK